MDDGLDDLFGGGGGNGAAANGAAAAANDAAAANGRAAASLERARGPEQPPSERHRGGGRAGGVDRRGLGASLVNDVWRDEIIPQWASRRADADVRARVLAEAPAALQGILGTGARRRVAGGGRRGGTVRWWRGRGSCANR